MTYHDRRYDLRCDGIMAALERLARIAPRPKEPTPDRSAGRPVFGAVNDLDVVMQLVEQAEAIHERNPEKDLSFGVDGQWEVTLSNPQPACAIQQQDQAA